MRAARKTTRLQVFGHTPTGAVRFPSRATTASPLERYGMLAELTATSRVGLHRYTFPASDDAGIVFDLINGGCWDKATDTHIRVESDRRISGWRHSTGWAKN